MKQRVHLSFRMLAVIVAVVAAFGVMGVVFASSPNAAVIDDFTTGDDGISLEAFNNSFQVKTSSSFAAASNAVGGFRTAVLTGTFKAGSFGQRTRYSANTFAKTLGIGSDTGVTPDAYIKWDGTNNPAVLNPSGLGGVDLISGTNTGFVVEVRQADLPFNMTVNVYSGTKSSAWSISAQGGVGPGSHVDYFIPFSSFISMTDGGVDFASVGAIAWYINGTDSLDFQISDYETDNALEWGDLPENLPGGPVYPTTLANNGPRHTTSTFLRLGQNLDIEQDGQPSTDALGDDKDNNAPYPTGDEDGVEPNGLPRWNTTVGGQISYTVSSCTGTCYLYGWIDWDNNDFQPGDQVVSKTVTTGQGQQVSFPIPNNNFHDRNLYARFRLCATPDCNSVTGASATGEVEDYNWTFGPLAVTLNSLQAQPATTSPVLPLALVGGAAAILLGAVLVTRKSRKQSI